MSVTREGIVKVVQENDEALDRAMRIFAGCTCHPFVQGVSKQFVKKGKVSEKQRAAVRKFLRNVKSVEIDILFVKALEKQEKTVQADKKKKDDKQLKMNFDNAMEQSFLNDELRANGIDVEDPPAIKAAVEAYNKYDNLPEACREWIDWKNEYARREAEQEREAELRKRRERDGWDI